MLATAKPSARAAPGANGKHGKAHAVQAEAATLKKVEQRNRTYCVQLQNRCRLFDLEQGALKATYTKKKLTFKKRIEDYERRLSELKDLKLDPSGATFLTEPPAKAAATVEEAAAARRQTASGLMLDLDAVGSIRRQTKPTNGGLMIGRSLLSLQRLQRKHLDEYERAASALRRLEQDVGVSIDANLPRRSYTPPDSVEARAAGAKSSAFLAYQRGQIRAKEKELRQLGLRHSAKKRPKTAPSSNPPTSRDQRPPEAPRTPTSRESSCTCFARERPRRRRAERRARAARRRRATERSAEARESSKRRRRKLRSTGS